MILCVDPAPCPGLPAGADVRETARRLPCGHRPGECGTCPRCDACYFGLLEDHRCGADPEGS